MLKKEIAKINKVKQLKQLKRIYKKLSLKDGKDMYGKRKYN
jgi:hypothetical protein